MNKFCPFINGECRKDCVFRIHETAADADTITVCRLVLSTAVNSDLCDIIISEKEQENAQ